MMTDEMNHTEGQSPEQHHKRKSNLIRNIRNVLNIIFMLGALTGMILHFCSDKETGLYIILASIPFKLAELAIRLLGINRQSDY